jgi:glycosyltransferase involved in cell wall biosynthesis
VRIGIDYTTGVWHGAGVARYTRSLVRALLRMDRTNTYMLFYGGAGLPRDTPEYAFLTDLLAHHRNARAHELPMSARMLGILWNRLRMPVAADRMIGGVDVLHAPDFIAPPVRGARSVITIHDLSFLVLPDVIDPGNRAYLQRHVPRAARQATRVVAVSETTRRDVIEWLQIPPERVVTVHNGVDAQFHSFAYGDLQAEAPAARRRLGLPPRYLLHVGTIEPRKNLVRLIHAYARLVQHGRDAGHDLVLAGRPGWMYDSVYQAAATSGMAGRIHFLDYVPEEDLALLYNMATAFVYPSLYEGFGLPVLEAMACGTPVISSRAPALAEIGGQAVMLVDPEAEEAITAALDLLLESAEVRRNLHAAGLQRAALYPWSAAANQMLGLYESLA